MARFEGKVAIVTGGASGVGAATVARLVGEGARVMVADMNEPAASDPATAFHRIDLSDAAAIPGLIAATRARWGGLDVLVNNAGVGALGDTDETDEAMWDRLFAVNAKAVFLASKAALPALRARGGGAIVNTVSISGQRGDYGMVAYNASKGAALNYTRALALDAAVYNIRVNAVCPGLIDTPMSRGTVDDPVDRDFWFERIPLGRPASAEDVAAVIAFLASDDAAYVTGVAIPVDGGMGTHTGQPNFPVRIRGRMDRERAGAG